MKVIKVHELTKEPDLKTKRITRFGSIVYRPIVRTAGIITVRKQKDGLPKFGWSRCSENDTFDMSTGIGIALGRELTAAEILDGFGDQIPKTISYALKPMAAESLGYSTRRS